MVSRWQPHLEEALHLAGLDGSIALRVEATEQFCDRVAVLITRGYLAGKTSWTAADAAINHLYPIMLECPEIPAYAWDVYEAFDAAEYHPDQPDLSQDEITKPLLLALSGGECA